MKPYLKVIINKIKLTYIKVIKCKQLKLFGYQLFSYNSKLLFSKKSSVYLDDNAKLIIGNNVYFNENNMISVKSSVEIGDGCQFGPNVKIFDNNHMFTSNEGVLPLHKSSPIKIGKKCWISSDVIILKGVSIGDNCVIGAGCIIKDDIPSKSIVTLQNNLKIRHIEDKA